MNVEVIKGNNRVYAHRKGGSGKGKLRVAAYCRVSTNDEDQLKAIVRRLYTIQSS